jgi:hypothetical protein
MKFSGLPVGKIKNIQIMNAEVFTAVNVNVRLCSLPGCGFGR